MINNNSSNRFFASGAEAAEQLRSVIENINGGVSVVVYGADGAVRIGYANDRYYEIFGYTKEQFLAELEDPHDVLHPEDAQYAGAVIERVKSTQQAESFKYRARKRDGQIVYVRCSSSVTDIAGIDGSVLISVLTDITSSEEPEQTALVAGERMREIMEHINNGVTACTVDAAGNAQYIFSTDRYYEMLGYTRAQFEEEVSDPFNLVYAQDAESVRRECASMVTLGQTKVLEFRVIRRDGSLIWQKCVLTLMRIANVAEPVQLSVFTDITALKQTEEQLRQQQEQMMTVLNSTPGGIAVAELDADNLPDSLRITYYNDRFFAFSGYSKEEYTKLLETNPNYFALEEDIPALTAAMRRLCAGEVGDSTDITLRCHVKDGTYRWLLLTEQLAKKTGTHCVLHIVMVDITQRKQAIEEKRISDEMLRIAAETDKRAIILYDVKKNTCHVESRNLYSAKYGEVIENATQTLLELGIVEPDSAEELSRLFSCIREGEKRVSVSLQMHTGRDEYQWFECNAATVFDADSQPDHAVLVFHNITEQRVKEAVFKKWQQSIAMRPPESFTLFRCNLSRDASLDERDGKLIQVEFAAKSMTFNARTQEYAEQFVYPEDREAYSALLDSDALLSMFYRGKHSTALEYREMGDNGECRWRLLTVELVEYLNSGDVQAFLMYEDIDERKKAELKEKEMAQTDPLTGVLNRTAFAEKVDALIHDEPGLQHALLMLDMDGFKLLNDTFGHAAGDQELVDVAAILRSLTRECDYICRLGGDEFLILLRDISYDAVISKTAHTICKRVHKEFSPEVRISASIGIAVFSRDGQNFDELYHHADKALYMVKKNGRDNFAFYGGFEASDKTAEVIPVATGSVARAKRRMLVVDDNETNRQMLTAVFKDEYRVETAKNGADAMLQLRHFASSLSIVLLDLIMPDIDGFAVLQKMQNNAELQTIPVIVVSSDDKPKTLLRAIESGATDYVTKPVDVELIRIRVRAAISKAENERLRAQNSYLQLQRDEELKFHTVLESTGTVVVEYDWRNHVFLYDNSISKHIAGNYNNRSIWNVFLSDFVAQSEDVKALQSMMHDLANDREKIRASRLVLLKTPLNQKDWFRMNIYKKVDDFGLADKMILTFNDVHEDVLANDKLLYQAQRDELTGLYNRNGFLEKASALIAEKESGYFVLSCLDIEKFKVINDQYGTKKGDEILCALARVLTELHDTAESVCCRINADNFAVLYPRSLLGMPALTQAHKLAENSDGSIPPLKVSVGRCIVDDKTLAVSAIFDRASIAKETVKGRYDASIATYDESMRTGLLQQQKIISQMDEALRQEQFEAWLQPQFNHATGALTGAEALVRWRHPKEGLISPGVFIPIFERNGFVYEVDKFVWESCCRLQRRWLDSGVATVPISVNISRYDVFRPDLIDFIQGLMKKYALPVDLLRLEITESAFSESAEQIISVVKQFVALGFTVEIDDFGSGYSSLNTLKDVPAQVIKMDMRFFRNSSDSQRGGNIIESVVRMSRWLGMEVIAEGVEEKDQADFLKSIGCDIIQGYLYSRPLPQSDYEALLLKSEKDSQLHGLQTLETWNNNAFWNPQSMETLIFNSYVGGACIFEFHNENTELLRVNDRYVQELGVFGKDSDSLDKVSLTRFLDEDNRNVMLGNIHKALENKKESVCELQLTDPSRFPGHTEYIRATVRVIALTEDRFLFYEVIYNITEQRDAERKQIESAQQLEVIMGNIDGGVSAVLIEEDGTSQFVFNNEKYYGLYGYTKKEALTEKLDVMTRILPEDIAGVLSAIRQLKKDKKPTVIDYRIKKKDGSLALLRAYASLMSMKGYGDEVIASVLTDITKQQELSDKFKAVVENINGGVSATYLRADAPEYVIVNDRYYDIIGYTKEQFEAEVPNVFALIHPDDRARVEAQFREAAIRQERYTMEYRFMRRDGEIRHILCNTNVIRLFGVEEPVQLAVSNDITELRESQQKIAESADKLQTVLDHADNGMTAVALRKGKPEFLFANRKYYELIGYTPETYLKNTVEDIFAVIHPEDRDAVREKIMGITGRDDSLCIDYRIVRPDGTQLWIRTTVTITEMTGIDVPVQIALFSDITEEKNANDQLRFLNDTAHDILAQPDSEKALHFTLRELMEYFGAQRGYVVELDYEKNLSYNTYEVCAQGVSSQRENLQGIPFGTDDFWYDAIVRHEYFIVSDVEQLGEEEAPLRELLEAQGIRAVILAGLWKEGQLIGFVGVDNPTRATEQVNRLTALGDYIAILLTRRDLLLNIERDAGAMRLLVDDTPGGFCRMELHADANPSLVIFNSGLCRMLDMTEQEVWDAYGADMLRCLNAEDIPCAMLDSENAHFHGGQFSTKCRLRKKDGSFLWVMVFGRFVNDAGSKTYLNTYFTDITRQLKAEELQKELLDNLPNGAALYEYDGTTMSVVHINKRYWQLVEREPVDYERSSVLGVVHPDDLEVVKQEIAASVRQQRDISVNLRIRGKGSEYKPFHISATIMPKPDGKYLFYASYTPITSEFMSIQEMIPIAISTMMSSSENLSYVKGKDMRYICASQSVADMAGLKDSRELNGKTAAEVFDAAFAEQFDADDEKVITTGQPVIGKVENAPFADGSIHTMRTAKYPVKDASGNVVGVYCLSIDITAQKETEARLELLTSTIPGGLAAYSLGNDGFRTLYFNDGYYAYSGYTRAEYTAMIEKDPLALMVEEDRAALRKMISEFSRNKQDGLTGECVYRCRTKSGSMRWMKLKAALTQIGENQFVLNVVQLDVSEQIEAENLQMELLDNLPCGAALYRFDGKKLWAVHINKQYERMTQRHTNSGNSSRSPMDFIHPEDREKVLAALREAIQKERDAVINIRILCAEDTYRVFCVCAHITSQSDGIHSLYVTYSEA